MRPRRCSRRLPTRCRVRAAGRWPFPYEILITVQKPAGTTLSGPILCGIAGSILLGGLALCLLIARRHGTAEPDDTLHGLAAEETANEE